MHHIAITTTSNPIQTQSNESSHHVVVAPTQSIEAVGADRKQNITQTEMHKSSEIRASEIGFEGMMY